MSSSEKIYPVRRPLAALLAGAAVALLGGLIGLGGAEFRLPLLIAMFELFPQRAVRINLLISLATLAASAAARLSFVQETNVSAFGIEIAGLLVGGVAAAWLGAGALLRLPKARLVPIIAGLLLLVAVLLVAETMLAEATGAVVPASLLPRAFAALAAGVVVGAVSSLLGVAGGELLIPAMIFLFGADVRTAGTASVLVSLPIVLTGIARHVLTGHFRSHSVLAYLVLPMTVGSLAGAVIGGYAAAYVPTDALRLVLGAILAISAVKLLLGKKAY